MEKKYIIGGIIGIALLGALYYYSDDIGDMMGYYQKSDEIKDFSQKKIKSKPINIKIENLNEL